MIIDNPNRLTESLEKTPRFWSQISPESDLISAGISGINWTNVVDFVLKLETIVLVINLMLITIL